MIIEVEEIPEAFSAFWRKAIADDAITIKFDGINEDGIGPVIAFIIPREAVQFIDDRLVMTLSEEKARELAKGILEADKWEPAS